MKERNRGGQKSGWERAENEEWIANPHAKDWMRDRRGDWE